MNNVRLQAHNRGCSRVYEGQYSNILQGKLSENEFEDVLNRANQVSRNFYSPICWYIFTFIIVIPALILPIYLYNESDYFYFPILIDVFIIMMVSAAMRRRIYYYRFSMQHLLLDLNGQYFNRGITFCFDTYTYAILIEVEREFQVSYQQQEQVYVQPVQNKDFDMYQHIPPQYNEQYNPNSANNQNVNNNNSANNNFAFNNNNPNNFNDNNNNFAFNNNQNNFNDNSSNQNFNYNNYNGNGNNVNPPYYNNYQPSTQDNFQHHPYNDTSSYQDPNKKN